MADGTLLFKTALDETGLTKGLSNIKKATGTAFSVAAKSVAAVSGALTAGATAGVLYNSTIENYTTSFEVMTGSADKAVEVVDKLKEIGATTPFELVGLADTTQLLMNYGFTADDAIDRMTMLGDISQGNADKMTRIATAYGQMSSAGKVQLEDIKQMIEAGFNPLQEISQTTGEIMESLYDRISKGAISVDEITASMQRSTEEGGKYYQSMEKQSQTFSGQISTLKDNAQMLLGEVVQPISESMVNTLIPAAINSIEELATAFEQDGAEGLIQAAGVMIADFITKAAGYAPQMVELAVQLINALIKGIIDNLPQLIEAAGKIGTAILDGIGDLCPFLEPVTDALKNITDNLEDLVPVIGAVVTAMVVFKSGMMITSLISAVVGWVKKMSAAYVVAASEEEGLTVAQWLLNAAMNANVISIIVIAIAALVAAFIYLWNNCDSFREFWINLWEKIKTACSEAWDSIVGFFMETVPEFINNLGKWFSELPAKMWEWLVSVVTKVLEWKANMINKAIETGSEFISNIVTFISELPEKIAYWIGYALGAIISWGISLVEWAKVNIPIFIESIITFFSELPGKIWEWLVNTINKVGEWAGNMVAKAQEVGSQFIKNVISFIKNLPSRIWEWFTNTIAKVLDFKEDMKTKAKQAGKGFLDNLIDAVKSLPDKMKEIGSNIVSGIWNGISGGWSWLIGEVKNLANSLFQGAKDALDIHSPSKKFKWLGEMCVEGMDEPLRDYNPYGTLKASMQVNAGVMRANFMGSIGAAGAARSVSPVATTNNNTQTVNIYQPVKTPSETARAIRLEQQYGLAGG